MSVDILAIVAAFAAGALLALGFFWGLWTTVAGLGAARRPAARLLASGLLRFALVLLGFFLIARYGSWEALAAATVGFVVARALVVRAIARPDGRGEPAP